jgi:hypothetical protein
LAVPSRSIRGKPLYWGFVMRAHCEGPYSRFATIAAGLLWAMMLAQPVLAQERPQPVLEFAAGSLLFADDGVVKEDFLAGAGRIYLTPRLSVGPEVAFISGGSHSHLILTGNLTCDLLSPIHGQPRRLTPFVVVGAGLFSTHEEFFNGPFVHNEGAFTAGGGIRVHVGQRVMAGVEARLGWEPHLRGNGFLTVRLGSS